jgi:hypothetical protein
MNDIKKQLTVEEAMAKAGLEQFVNDEEAKEIMKLGEKEFYKHCSHSKRSSARMLEIYKIINPIGLKEEAQELYC